MNLFRPEEHARNWWSFDPQLAPRMLKPVAAWAEIFSNPFLTERSRVDYISWIGSADGQAAFAALRARLAG